LRSNSILSNFSIALFKLFTVCSLKNTQVTQSITVSKAHHFLYAITGVPDACASIGTSQKSSSGGNKKAKALLYKFIIFGLGRFINHFILLFDFAFRVL
jgi:hypothetical protein